MAPRKEAVWASNSSRPPQRSSLAFWKCITVIILLSVIMLLNVRVKQPCFLSWRPRHNEHLPRYLKYPGERITWETCGSLKGRPLECSVIDVPMDHFNASNSGNKTFSIPLIRVRGGDNAKQNLLLNPGGPGSSGIEFVYRRGEQLRSIVGEGFHLLSFDPRGVNGSRPQATCYPDAHTRRRRSGVRDNRVIADSIEAYTWSQNFVRACADTMGEHGQYLNTPQTAADMNSILDAVGQDAMHFWGFSYGSLLGQTYATLFPDRSKRVIIDGVENQFNWYEGLLSTETFHDTENVWDGFLEECIKAGENCTLSSLAPSKDALKERIFSFTQELKESPLSVYVNNSVYGILDYETVWYKAVLRALYHPDAWYSLADRLAKMLEGNATEALLAYRLGGQIQPAEADAHSLISFNDGASGASYWPQDRQSFLKILIPYMNASLFAPAEYGGYYIKQQWRIPRTHNYVPQKGVKTAHPLLILSTTYDPVCPLVSARSANAAFVGSNIIEVMGYGHCSPTVPSTCLVRHIREFLYNGTLPRDSHTRCEADGPYFVKPPEEDGQVRPRRQFDDPEMQKIHLAQVDLAENWEW